jgi:hypothetical protein
MSILLTPQQQEILDTRLGDALRVIDPRSNASYVLVPEAEYAAIREILEDERRRQEIHATALRNAAGRMYDAP